MWIIICIFMPFLENVPMRFQVISPNISAICESWKHLNLELMWFEFPTCTSNYCFFPWGASMAFILEMLSLYLMNQSGHVRRDQSQGICIDDLSWFDPCLLSWKCFGGCMEVANCPRPSTTTRKAWPNQQTINRFLLIGALQWLIQLIL